MRHLLPRREVLRKTRRWQATGLAGLWDQPDAPPSAKAIRNMQRDTYAAPAARAAGAPTGLPADVAALIDSGELTWPQVRQFRMIGNTYPPAEAIRKALRA